METPDPPAAQPATLLPVAGRFAGIAKLREGERRFFRWRGEEVSRLENFSDTVFAFALTLLVVSTEVPRNFDALMMILSAFPVFALSFLFLVTLWYNHYLFYRRYGLHDSLTVTINNVLLLLVLFCVYPLKFIALLTAPASPGGVYVGLYRWQFAVLFRVYAAALGSIFLTFALLYGRAWRMRDALQLSPAERLATVQRVMGFGLTMGVCVVSALFTLSPQTLDWAGVVYLVLVPTLAINRIVFRRRIRRVLAAV